MGGSSPTPVNRDLPSCPSYTPLKEKKREESPDAPTPTFGEPSRHKGGGEGEGEKASVGGITASDAVYVGRSSRKRKKKKGRRKKEGRGHFFSPVFSIFPPIFLWHCPRIPEKPGTGCIPRRTGTPEGKRRGGKKGKKETKISGVLTHRT